MTPKLPPECFQSGWRAFYIDGILDFSLVGILAKISGALSDGGVSIFAVSTFNTDYVLVKEDQLEEALNILKKIGVKIK